MNDDEYFEWFEALDKDDRRSALNDLKDKATMAGSYAVLRANLYMIDNEKATVEQIREVSAEMVKEYEDLIPSGVRDAMNTVEQELND